MLAALLTTLLWAGSAVCGARSARILGGTSANFWRLVVATSLLGIWAHTLGRGLGGASFRLFFLSGLIGVGADVFLFQSYTRLGSRLTILIIQCGAAIVGAAIEWIWQGTTLTVEQVIACATILTGVALALAPGKHLNLTRGAFVTGVIFSAMAACGNGFGAVLVREAYAVSRASQQLVDAPTAAYERLLGGLLIGTISFLVVQWRRKAAPPAAPEMDLIQHREKWKQAWPWVLANALAGQTIGVTCYQWALKEMPTAIVLAIVSTAPLVIIPFSRVLEGEKTTRRSLIGGVIAVGGAVVLALVTRK